MSVWGTLSAGFHIVQEKLDQALGDEENEPKGEVAKETEVETPDQPDKPSTTDKLPSTSVVEEKDNEPDHSVVIDESGKLEELRQALQQAEQQNQLLNSEYSKLLREKEDEIRSLKTSAKPSSDQEEMAQLKEQLRGKEAALNELNAKAEAKFTKLKAQAKARITTLTEELEKLRSEQGGAAGNVSVQSLEGSFASGDSPLAQLQEELEATQRTIESKKAELQRSQAELDAKKAELVQVKSVLESKDVELQSKGAELERKQEELEYSKTKLQHNRAELDSKKEEIETLRECLQTQDAELAAKEEKLASLSKQLQEEAAEKRKAGRQAMTLTEQLKNAQFQQEELLDRVSMLDQQLYDRSEALDKVIAAKDELGLELEKEVEEKKKLAQQLNELSPKSETGITRDFSFASSEFQIVSGGLSPPGDSEEEWKVVNVGSSQSSDGNSKDSPPLEILSLPEEDSPSRKTTPGMEKSGIEDDTLKQSPTVVQEQRQEAQHLRAHLHKLQEQLATKTRECSNLERNLREATDKLVQLEAAQKEADISSQRLKEAFEDARKELVVKKEKEKELELKLSTSMVDTELAERRYTDTNEKLTREKEKVTLRNLQVDELKEMLRQLQGEVESLTGALNQQQQEEKKERLQVEQLRGAHVAMETHSAELTSKLKLKEAAVAGLEEKLAHQQESTSKLQRRVQELEVKVKEKEKSASAEKMQLQSNLAALQEEKKELMEAFAQEKKALEAEKEQVSARTKKVEEAERKAQRELERACKAESQLQQSNKELSSQIKKVQADLRAAEESCEREKVKQESLQGQLNRLTESSKTFSADSAKWRERVLHLEDELSSVSKNRNLLDQQLTSCREQLTGVSRELGEEKKQSQSLSTELTKYQRETGQLKSQFESAIKMMEEQSSQMKVELEQLRFEVVQKEQMCGSLREQVAAESQRSGQLQDEKRQLTVNLKTITSRSELLQNENRELQGELASLAAEQNQLQHSLEMSMSERERFQRDHEMSQRGAQTYESRILELTNQLAVIVREKSTAEEGIRQLQRELAGKENENQTIKEEMEALRSQLAGQSAWTRERQSILSAKATLTQENASLLQVKERLEERVRELEAGVAHLEEECSTLQHATQLAKEAESASSAQESRRVQGLEHKIAELQSSHRLEVGRLQEELGNARAMAEQQQHHAGDVSIGMEDLAEGGGTTNGDTTKLIVSWIQRFMKNPNIVLVRLLRATPQTKLFFLGYLVIIHLFLVILLLA